jgi:catechol 2,3-dioxygenase-like lactoylglutathione lyase family enzyme
MPSKNWSRPAIGRFDHVAIEVKNLDSAIEFYHNILGLKALAMPDGLREKGIYWLDLGSAIALHLIEKADSLPGTKAHMAIVVSDVSAWQTYLDSLGIESRPSQVNIYQAERIFISDPSGNRIELVKWL